MADERTYIRVHDGIEDHPKIDPLTDKAFRLLVTTWGWCSRHLTDGRVPIGVWKKRGTSKARRELIDAGLVEVYDDHIVMHDYLEHQRSAALVAERSEAKRKAARMGNHKRWHAAQGIYEPSCEYCLEGAPPEPPPIDDPSHNPSQLRSSRESHNRSQDESQNDRKTSPEVETEVEGYGVTGAGGSYETYEPAEPPPQGLPAERPPETCPRHRGDPSPPNCGKCADHRRAAESWDEQAKQRKQHITDEIARARADHRQQCEHGTDGGLYLRPDTGQSATCAQCRQAQHAQAS